ncbi:MAG: OB-fold domain-containing protein [Thermodesulfobacteriota bacterium]|nr:OB-fold domain-containing protein [Thermodesulfobacteriota bacterium]
MEKIQKEWSFDFDYSVSMGETYTVFMEGLKDKKFLGNRIGDRTFFPPRNFCDRTFKLPDEWLESDGSGTVEAFTVCYRESNSVQYPLPRDLPGFPRVIGVIRINNSDQCFIHFLSGFDAKAPEDIPAGIQAGMKVRPVWAKDRTGCILDIEYFEPVE